ncbi:MAG: radical SAM peptide maturase, CXXX-repeat target family [Clostridiales bacterium]|nr:radical SAM peptide maturase, CXXX-repeat target family [Clostridiales bacterium]
MSEYMVGKNVEIWNEGNSQTITFVVTDACNLRCKYCYITHKSSEKKMDYETGKKFIDYILSADINFPNSVVLEFIGGEPLLEIDLIDRLSDYFKIRAFEIDHPWYWNYRFNICTNGVNYSNSKVQEYIAKNKDKLSLSITIDGTKTKHDLQRVFPDGSGSYDQISGNIEIWKSQFRANTKVTFAHADLCYLQESIISLWEMGIHDISANVVFENVWEYDDDLVFEKQMILLADYIIENNLHNQYRCSLFDDNIGGFYGLNDLTSTSCGAGKMIAVGNDGKIYPCIRFRSYSLNNKDEWCIGDVNSGIDMEKVRPFMTATYALQSDSECLECPVAWGCSFCQGFCYDESPDSTNFYRAKYICKMHKARVRANDYYFSKLLNIYGIKKDFNGRDTQRLYFLLSDDHVDYCSVSNSSNSETLMSSNDILQGLKFCRKDFFRPIFVHSSKKFTYSHDDAYNDYTIFHMVPAKFYEESKTLKECMLIFDKQSVYLPIYGLISCMLNVNSNDICLLNELVSVLLEKSSRINLNILDVERTFNNAVYKSQLEKIMLNLVKYHEAGISKEVNLITDLCYIDDFDNCKAGNRSFVYAPDSKIYVCSAFYGKDKIDSVGDAYIGIKGTFNKEMYKNSRRPICSNCDSYQCLGCIYINVKTTREINVPPSFQCKKSHIEREISNLYRLKIEKEGLTEIGYDDPIVKILENVKIGYYTV